MLKKLLVLTILALMFVPSVLAVDSTRTVKIQETSRAAKVQEIEDKLCKLFKNRPVEYGRLLENQVKKIQRIKTAAAEAKSKGKDVTGVETLIANAESAIAEVKTAITDLKAITCPEISASASARIEATVALKTLKTKLEAIRVSFTKASKAILEATKALAQVNGGAK